MITVVIAAKDAERWLEKTMKSLFAQSLEDWQCIISINGSSDRTEDIARSTGDSRIRVMTSNIPNKSCAVNRALIQINTEFVCILDADDIWHESKLKKQLETFLEDDVDILGTQMSYIDETDQEIKSAPILPTFHKECVDWLMIGNNPIANSSVMYRKQIHDKVGYYDPEKFATEDYDMWMRSMRLGLKMKNCGDKLLFHRVHSSSNYNSTNKQQILKHLVDATNSFYAQHRNELT